MHLTIRMLDRGHSIYPGGPGLPLSRFTHSGKDRLVGFCWWSCACLCGLISETNEHDLGWSAFCIDRGELAVLLYQLTCFIRNRLNGAETEIFWVTFSLITQPHSRVWVPCLWPALWINQVCPWHGQGWPVIFHNTCCHLVSLADWKKLCAQSFVSEL